MIRPNKRYGDWDVYVRVDGKRHKVGHASTREEAEKLLQEAYYFKEFKAGLKGTVTNGKESN